VWLDSGLLVSSSSSLFTTGTMLPPSLMDENPEEPFLEKFITRRVDCNVDYHPDSLIAELQWGWFSMIKLKSTTLYVGHFEHVKTVILHLLKCMMAYEGKETLTANSLPPIPPNKLLCDENATKQKNAVRISNDFTEAERYTQQRKLMEL